MFGLHKRLGFIAYETPEASPAGTPPTGTPQPGAPGQGQPQGDGFRQTHFSNVPDEQWAVVEPHVRGVQGYVTQLEQRLAPIKNYTPEAVQGLARFAQEFEANPVGQWINIARMLEQRGVLTDLDVDYLEKIATGQPVDDDEGLGEPGAPQPQEDQIPPWAQQLLQRLDQLEGGVKQFQGTQQERVNKAVLNRQLTHMKTELVKAGFPEEALDANTLTAQFIAHGGNANAAVQSMSNMRSTLLKGIVPGNGQQQQRQKDLDLPNGAPPRKTPPRGRQSRGMFSNDVTAAAEQALARANQSQ